MPAAYEAADTKKFAATLVKKKSKTILMVHKDFLKKIELMTSDFYHW